MTGHYICAEATLVAKQKLLYSIDRLDLSNTFLLFGSNTLGVVFDRIFLKDFRIYIMVFKQSSKTFIFYSNHNLNQFVYYLIMCSE